MHVTWEVGEEPDQRTWTSREATSRDAYAVLRRSKPDSLLVFSHRHPRASLQMPCVSGAAEEAGQHTCISRDATWSPLAASPPLLEARPKGLGGAARGEDPPEVGGLGGFPVDRWRSRAPFSLSAAARLASSSATCACTMTVPQHLQLEQCMATARPSNARRPDNQEHAAINTLCMAWQSTAGGDGSESGHILL